MAKNIKKFLSLFVVLVLTLFVFACGDDKGKENANVSGADDTYISVTENSVTYKVTKGKLYSELKSTVGYSSLINLVMTDILTENGKLAEVTEEAIKEAIDEAIYGDDEDLTAEEKADLEKEFLNNMFRNYGYSGTNVYAEEIKAVYRLNLAKELYAKAKLEEEIVEHDKSYNEWVEAGSDEEDEDAVTTPYFTEAALKSQYATSNPSEFWAIIIPFTTLNDYNVALEATGKKVEFENKTLSKEEVLAVFIDLYKQVYGYKLTTEDNLDTTTLTEESKFYYTQSGLKSYSSQLATVIADNYNCYKNSDTKYYSAKPETVNSGAYYALVLKLDEVVAKEYDELNAEEKLAADNAAKEVIKDSKLTNTYITTKMYEAMAEKNFNIYDSSLASTYASSAVTYGIEFEATEKVSKTDVAYMDGKTYTADELFAAMDEVAGMTTALSEINYERYLNNSAINTYYSVSDGKWLDKDVQEDIEDDVATEKKNFENGDYVDYGYDPETISWVEFIRSVYAVNSEEELTVLFLYNRLVSDFTAGLNDVNEKVDDAFVESKVWPLIQTKMEEQFNKYYSVKGIHLLICVFDDPTHEVSSGTPTDPETWTEVQRTEAVNLYNEVKEFVADCKGTYTSRLQKIQKAFDECARTNVQNVLVSDNGNKTINVGKYRALGLYAKFENLGSFKNGSMVESFDAAVKVIYDQDMADEKTDRTTVAANMIETEYGYHYYVNLGSTKASTYSVKVNEVSTTFNLPRIEEVREFLADEDNVNSDTKAIINTYYVPVANQISGSYLTYVLQYDAIKAIIDTVDVKSDKYTKEDLVRIMELELADWYEDNLTYITEADLSYFK